MSVISKGKQTNRDGKDILNVIYETWRNESKGQKIVGCWIGGLVIASIWGIYTKRRLKVSEKAERIMPITRKLPSSFLLKNRENSDPNNLEEDEMKSEDLDRAVSMLSADQETPADQEDQANGNNKGRNKDNSFSTFKSVLDIAIPKVFSSPILWSTLLSTSLIWKSSNISQVNDSIGSMGELLVCKRWKLLSDATMEFAVKTVYAALSIATVNFLCKLLSLSLRDNLVVCMKEKYKYSSRSTKQPILYNTKQEIADIDARMCRDINEWSETYSTCFVSFCKPLIDVSIYSQKLVNRIGVQYYGQCIFYFFVSSMWTRGILPSYASMKHTLLRHEAKFQSNNKRIIEYCEEIYYLNGIETEIKLLDESYYKLYHKLSMISIYDYVYEFSHNYVVRYLGILASFVCLLPMIKNEKQPTEFLLNNLHDLVNIGLAFRDLMKSSKEFQSLKGISNRINALNEKLQQQLSAFSHHLPLNPLLAANNNLFYDDDSDQDYDDDDEDDEEQDEQAQNGHAVDRTQNKKKRKNIDIYKDDIVEDEEFALKRERNSKQVISFKNVTIKTPDKSKVLLREFTFQINLGENVLIVGPNGAGKSSLIRVMTGLWKCSCGQIKIRSKMITDQEIYILPARTYLIPGLSVKQQLLYPDIDSVGSTNNISDEMIIELLNECGLGRLVEYIDDINDCRHIDEQFWCHLSAGEKQLISLCRALLKCKASNPVKLLFVDEALSNLSSEKIQWFYDKLSELCITVVTISHNINHIKQYHHRLLTLIGDDSGKYTVDKLE